MRRSDGIERTRHAGSHEIEPGEGVRGVIAAVAGARVAARAATRASRISDPRLCATARLLARFEPVAEGARTSARLHQSCCFGPTRTWSHMRHA